jgi:signal transduction histidine kinase
MPEEVEVALFFVASEALANVAKYAGAARAWMSAATVDGRATIEVGDDGVGGADTGRGTGLRGLADRIEAIGGTFVVESSPGSGTRVVASVPFG